MGWCLLDRPCFGSVWLWHWGLRSSCGRWSWHLPFLCSGFGGPGQVPPSRSDDRTPDDRTSLPGRPKKPGPPTTTLFIKLSDTSQVALVANQAQTLKQVRQYVVKNISPRRAKFKLHVPDSELLLSR